MHSVKLEPTKLILRGSRTTYQCTRDAGCSAFAVVDSRPGRVFYVCHFFQDFAGAWAKRHRVIHQMYTMYSSSLGYIYIYMSIYMLRKGIFWNEILQGTSSIWPGCQSELIRHFRHVFISTRWCFCVFIHVSPSRAYLMAFGRNRMPRKREVPIFW